jgi:hypothetical protein
MGSRSLSSRSFANVNLKKPSALKTSLRNAPGSNGRPWLPAEVRTASSVLDHAVSGSGNVGLVILTLHAHTTLGMSALTAVILAATCLVSSSANACGVSTADGFSSCSLQEHDEAVRPRWHVGASAIYTSTTIQFTGGLRSDETRQAVVVSLAYQPSRRLTFQGAAGGTFGGQLSTPAGKHDLSTGPTVAAGASWRAIDGSRPFVLLTANASFSAANTQLVDSAGGAAGPKEGYRAFDLRVGALVGTTFFHTLSPYGLARAFGGPVFWRYAGSDVVGGDVHHYQLGGGLTLTLATRVNLFAEGIPLGERALSAGAAFAF